MTSPHPCLQWQQTAQIGFLLHGPPQFTCPSSGSKLQSHNFQHLSHCTHTAFSGKKLHYHSFLFYGSLQVTTAFSGSMLHSLPASLETQITLASIGSMLHCHVFYLLLHCSLPLLSVVASCTVIVFCFLAHCISQQPPVAAHCTGTYYSISCPQLKASSSGNRCTARSSSISRTALTTASSGSNLNCHDFLFCG